MQSREERLAKKRAYQRIYNKRPDRVAKERARGRSQQRKDWVQTPVGREWVRRNRSSVKTKERERDYRQEKVWYVEKQHRYRASPKGQETIFRAHEVRRLKRKANASP